ncbi:response regulator [Mediterraneibacter sp. ICN-202921]|uniref:response regulator n=1 Tax=Mediterraneibacter sp. ICN-202921 TaxID=3134657 RepID=UPI0030C544C0
MRLLKLVLVDDEAILLQGLLNTYDWKSMGFEVVGTAQSGEQAIDLIQEVQPHVVLTDIRMKQITGLMVMEQTHKAGVDCLFIVLSAYRDFEYAQQACELGAYAYLLKPVEDEKLQETMRGAYETCMEQLEHEERYESWEKLLMKDATSFLQMVVQKYVQNRIPEEKVQEVFDTIGNVLDVNDRFITVCVDIDLTYKITNSLDYEASRFAVLKNLEEIIGQRYAYWRFEGEDGNCIFIVKTTENATVRELKTILEKAKKEEKSPVVASISKPYKGISGIKRSCEEAQKLFSLASASGASAFTIPEEIEEKTGGTSSLDVELLIVNAVRRNDLQELKEAFIQFIYGLPGEEELQCQYMHRVMLRVELMLNDSHGMEGNLKEQFQNYYSNIPNLNAAKTVDVCYKILCSVIMSRTENIQNEEMKYFKEYMSVAVAYIEEHLDDEELSIVSVASHVYLNPVYFGRVFKNTFQMTFKKYLLKQRMEKAKRLLERGEESIGEICSQVGINNPSYFSHLFKQYTGKLPSEYKKEFET